LAGGGNHFPGYPRFLAVWDADTGKDLFHFSERPIRSLAYSPNGDLLAAGTVSGRVEMWEAVSGVELDGLPAHQGWRPIVCWSPDGKALACAGSSWLRVQAIESGSGRVLREASTITQELVGATAWSNDPDLLTYANGNHAFVWRLSSGEEWGFQGPGNFAPCSSSWSPDGRTIAAGNYRGEAEILELTKPEPKRTPVGAKAKTLAFSPDGKALAVAEDREAKLCDPKSGKVVEVLGAAGAPIGNLSWSPDGKLIATSCEDKKLYVFDVSGKRLAATCQGHQEQAISLGWSEDGKTLISGSASEVCVWDAASGKLLRTIADDGGAISRDGRLVAARGHSAVRIRQIDDGRLLRTLMSLRDQQYAAVSPEGHFRGSPDVEKEFVYVVQTDNGQETLTPEEFSKRFGWKNDSSRVELTAETKSADAKAKPEKKAEAAKTQQANPAK
jgi:WD40 repeat protein